jgi:hypothetical protein
LQSEAWGLWQEDLLYIVDVDHVGAAASGLGDQLPRRGPERFFLERDIGCGADLVGQQGVDFRVVVVELGEFGRNVAGWLQSAGGECVLDWNIRGATPGESCEENR